LANHHDIRRLDPTGYARARTALARAFFDYELMRYAAPDDRRRGPGVDLLYGAILWDCLRWGEVWATAEGNGVAAWLPPHTPMATFWRQARAGMLALPLRFGIRGFRRLLAYDAVAQHLHHAHAGMPHWYLAVIGVEPKFQGQGLGGALMQPILARADAERLHCYLETQIPANVRLYEKHGFEVTQKADVPGHPIPVWAMLRNPRKIV
jgi:ribosomal protein S18 acetylase RimI-like enzyme